MMIHVNPAMTGPHMARTLRLVGIHAADVTRRRKTGEYVAAFFVPGMQDAVEPAASYAARIAGIAGTRIVDAFDTIAHWRAGNPVIEATVLFEITEVQPVKVAPVCTALGFPVCRAIVLYAGHKKCP